MYNFETPLIGVSQAIIKTRELIAHVADTGLNIVITGESGVGKEVVAQNLYYSSSRNGKPFVKVNCAALPDGLLESELFGYERGAFTGAEKKKRGKFELADGGVLFLDEIGDMSILLQAKLLHVLQSGEFAPLGSETDKKTDTWVLAATNRKLNDDIKNGTFRKDLYYRLNTINIHIPPLRKRREDIPFLIEYFVDLYNEQFKLKPPYKPDRKTFERLVSYHWPGNVRELQNILKRLMVVGDFEAIRQEFEEEAEPASDANQQSTNKKQVAATLPHCNEIKELEELDFSNFSLKKIKKKASDRAEKKAIALVLSKTHWNRSKASKILQISYKTLLYKISELGIEPTGGGETDSSFGLFP
jgi:transcriptional regulator with PAS, ATPase and Fis domain